MSGGGAHPTRVAIGHRPHQNRATDDHIGHGTLTLFAALDYLEGKLITTIAEQHRHQECLAFRKKIDRETARDLAVHLLADWPPGG